MIRWMLMLALCGMAGCAAGSGAGPVAEVNLEPVLYTRAGGLAGRELIVRIDPDGRYVAQYGADVVEGMLRPEQRARLAAMFQGWGGLVSEYPPVPGAADYYTYTIRYGDEVVTATDASPNVPPQFVRLREALNSLAP